MSLQTIGNFGLIALAITILYERFTDWRNDNKIRECFESFLLVEIYTNYLNAKTNISTIENFYNNCGTQQKILGKKQFFFFSAWKSLLSSGAIKHFSKSEIMSINDIYTVFEVCDKEIINGYFLWDHEKRIEQKLKMDRDIMIIKDNIVSIEKYPYFINNLDKMKMLIQNSPGFEVYLGKIAQNGHNRHIWQTGTHPV